MTAYSTLLMTHNPLCYWPLQDTSSPDNGIQNLGSIVTPALNGGPNSVAPTFHATGPLVDGSFAMTFNGTTQLIDLESSANIMSTNTQGTVIVWFRATGSAGYVFSFASSSANSLFALQVGSGTQLSWALRKTSGATNRIGMSTPGNITGSAWHMCAITADGVNAAKIYIDGVNTNATQTDQGGSGTTSDWWDDMLSGGFFYTVGGRRIAATGIAVPYAGSAAQISIHTTVLSAAQILALYVAATLQGPQVDDLDPDLGTAGTTVNSVATGLRLDALTGITVSGTGVTASDQGGSATSRNIRFVIDLAATPGVRTVTFTNAGGNTTFPFTVLGPPPPSINVIPTPAKRIAAVRAPVAKKTRVAVIGTVGKSLKINPYATQGATIGEDLKMPDGSVVTLENLATAVAAASGAAPTPVSVTTWALIQNKPANIVALAAQSTTGVMVRLADGTYPTIAAGGSGNTGNILRSTGTVWESSIRLQLIDPDEAQFTGSSGTTATITGRNVSTVRLFSLEGDSSTSLFRVRNRISGGTLQLAGLVTSTITPLFLGDPNGAATLYFAGAAKLATVTGGAAVTGAISTSTGSLTSATNNTLTLTVNGETGADFTKDGAARLYFDNAVKLATVTGGVAVTGAVDTSTGSITTTNSTLTLSTSGENQIVMTKDGAVSLYYDNAIRLTTATNGLSLPTGSTDIIMSESGATGQHVKLYNSVAGASFGVGAGGNLNIEQTNSSGTVTASYIVGAAGAGITLYYNNVAAFSTVNQGTTGVQTSATVLDKNGVAQPVGFATWPFVQLSADTTLTAIYVGCRVNMAVAPHVYTTPASSDTDWPIGGWMFFSVGAASAGCTIAAGSGVSLVWFTGAGVTTSTPRTLAAGSTGTLYRRSSTAFDIYGFGIT